MTTKMPFHKYRPFQPVDLPDRRWPSRAISRAPRWCSVDLRDGNQALVEPMGLERKLRLFAELTRMGFKDIEVGFPAASAPDFEFVRHIIEHGLIPEDVTIQVLTQARPELIARTMESVRGARHAIVHLYNSTSTLQRRVVFGLDRAGIVDIAVRGTALVRSLARDMGETEIQLEYSPESFTGTELDFARDICEAVMDAWGVGAGRELIVNLPATVEMATPNVYADQVEWMSRNLKQREHVILSVHPHNDRGTAVAAAELAVMAGADRVEGTLFGNGERTGNVDVVTLAMNLFSQGIDPELDLSDIDALKRTVEHVNRLPVHPRHPYAGELVYTAFSGSHQDAIKKGLAALKESGSEQWEVPYLPIDPKDVGRSYEAVVRVNSQSGKSGVAFVLEQDHGYELPRELAVELSQHVQARAESTESEVKPSEIHALFRAEFVDRCTPVRVVGHSSDADERGERHAITIEVAGARSVLDETGNGPIDAFVRGLSRQTAMGLAVEAYSEHAAGRGADAEAVAYVALRAGGDRFWGVGRHASIVRASLDAVCAALNRMPDASDLCRALAAE
jgi:2-isopropylmalate synthase